MPRLRETSSAGGRSRTQGIFVVAQLSLSLVLLLAAGLSLRALQKAAAIDLGFNPRGLLTASYDLTLQNYPLDRRDAFRRDLSARLAALPDVASVTVADVPPLSGTMVSTMVTARDARGAGCRVARVHEQHRAGLFRNAGDPAACEAAESIGVTAAALRRSAVVNETLARQLWPDADPLGQQAAARWTRRRGRRRRARRQVRRGDGRPAPVPLSVARTAFAARSRDGHRSLRSRNAAHRPPSSRRRSTHSDPALPVFDVRPFDDRPPRSRGQAARHQRVVCRIRSAGAGARIAGSLRRDVLCGHPANPRDRRASRARCHAATTHEAHRCRRLPAGDDRSRCRRCARATTGAARSVR